MSCANSPEISFDFQTDSGITYLKIQPREMQFDRTRGSFDYCQAEFSDEVAKHLKLFIDDDTSVLRQPLPVNINIEDEPVARLLWVPEAAMFTDDEVHIEFHDLQKYLTRGEVTWRQKNVTLRDAYEHIFSKRDQSGPEVFNGIKFTDENQGYEELISKYRGKDRLLNFSGKVTEAYQDRVLQEAVEGNDGDSPRTSDEVISDLESKNVTNIIDGHSVVDFDKVSPWEAILELNEKFGMRTWAGPDGYFWVGARGARGVMHIATPDDGRVWKLSDYNITPPRDPVVSSRVRGGWVDDPSESHAENIFWESEILNRGTEEFRIEGVATLDNDEMFNFGQEIVTEINAKRDNLESIAKRQMMNKQRQQWEGYLEIIPEFSGDDVSDLKYVSIGDRILTIPPDSDSEDGGCESNIKEAVLDIVGVQHGLSAAGNWTVRLDVVPALKGDLSPDNISTRLRYFDPASKEFIETEEVEGDVDFWPEGFLEVSESDRIANVDTDEEFDTLT